MFLVAILEGQQVCTPGTSSHHRKRPDFQGWSWCFSGVVLQCDFAALVGYSMI